jgi:hypothetical protein
MRANQLRLWFASCAYVLLAALRRIGLRHTQFATATCGTIRLKLLKIGAQVRKSVRRIKIAMASACPTGPSTALRISTCAASPPPERPGIPRPSPDPRAGAARPKAAATSDLAPPSSADLLRAVPDRHPAGRAYPL